MSNFSSFYIFSIFLLIANASTHGIISSSMAEVMMSDVRSTYNEDSIEDNSQKNSANEDAINKVISYKTYATKDNLDSLIRQKQQVYGQDLLKQQTYSTIETNSSIDRYLPEYSYSAGIVIAEIDFKRWLNASVERKNAVARYQSYLASQLGEYNVPPMEQLLTTARSWANCGYEPYQLPPEYLWPNMVNTLRLYAVLRQQGILPATTQIRSVYRSPSLNECAGGATNSKHMSNGAIDIWVPEYDGNEWQINIMQNNLCNFWSYQGEPYNFGLGLYSTGSIHMDTQGYRKWGSSHSSSSSPCRF